MIAIHSTITRVCLALLTLLGATLEAQTNFQLLHAFQDAPASATGAVCVGADGALYGQAQQGGSGVGGPYGRSTIYKINPDGSGFSSLFDDVPPFFFGDSGPQCAGSSVYVLVGNLRLGATYGELVNVKQDGSASEGIQSFDQFTNTSSGRVPHGRLVDSSGVLYGRTEKGGVHDAGIIYKLNADGSGYKTLHDFDSGSTYPHANVYGGHPGLVVSGSALYGVDVDSTSAYVFYLGIDGTGFAVLHRFDAASGEVSSALTLSNGLLFGTTTASCASYCGAIFKLNLDGTGYTALHSFGVASGNAHSSLTSAEGVLYGTFGIDGSGDNLGAVYKINEDGTGFAVVHDFAASGMYPSTDLTIVGSSVYAIATVPFDGKAGHDGWTLLYKMATDGSGFGVVHEFRRLDGAYPNQLTSTGGVLYGTTSTGGASEGGTLFRLNRDGSGYVKLRDFNMGTEGSTMGPLTVVDGVIYGGLRDATYGAASSLYRINADGSGFSWLHAFSFDPSSGTYPHGRYPSGGMLESNGVLYGTTEGSGSRDRATLFSVLVNGAGFTELHDFDSSPHGKLVLRNGSLYGSLHGAGLFPLGSIFRFDLAGSAFTTIHTFAAADALGDADLSIFDGVLYGVTSAGGPTGGGVLFKMNLAGGDFEALHNFDINQSPQHLTRGGSRLYGTLSNPGHGGLFSIKLDGSEYTVLHGFTEADGYYPSALAAGGDGALYGALSTGGPHNAGSVYRALPSPPLPNGPGFGSFDLPGDGLAGVQGAIAATGWALSDNGIDRVELWRDPVTGDPAPAANGKIFIGNATFARGARPDVQALYPEYPDADRAGWGYMLLTNMLPNTGTGAPVGGVGTFTLYAHVYDVSGKLTILGPRTVACDNATGANKPFGTIDTPAQGATVSGQLDNFGWVLTPGTATIPTNGSTVQVFVDGNFLGTAQYNLPRSDIQTLFPGYTNTNGAIGYFPIDTTTLSNGVHTIYWVVTDDQNRTEGIGSRYFTVAN
jgi:uncharacterized repeat protein (TIGR03803 family)